MSSHEVVNVADNGWRECAKWLTRCRVLRGDHKANWPNATAFDLAYILRDGVVLCNLLNVIDPGCIDIKNVSQKPQLAQFLCIRNIKTFLTTCSTVFGLFNFELFEPSMLFDLSDFHRVLCTLSAISVCPRVRRKGIEGFLIEKNLSETQIYEDLQSARVGRENEDHRRRFRRIEGGESSIEEYNKDTAEEEDVYGDCCSYAQNEEIYQDLCSLHLPLPATTAQGVVVSGGEKRQFVVQELIETERNYCEVLGTLLRYFARPLAHVLRPEDATCIFFGIKELSEIHAGFHSQLCKSGNGADLARVFLEWRKRFLIYGDYCVNLTMAQFTVRDVCARNEVINQEIIRCQEEASKGRFKLRDILSVPMQRILKYHLLLDRLVKETPREWIDERKQLEKAREAMIDVSQYINDVKRDSDTLDVIKDIQGSIVDWNGLVDVQLKNFGRLLKDGELKVKAHDDQRVKARWVFVFEQAVLICKAGRGDQYYYKQTLPLDDYRLDDSVERRDSRWSYQWLLVHKEALNGRLHPARIYTLYARTNNQRTAWIKALHEAMDNINPAACRRTDHKFKLTTFNAARCCQHCDKFLKGRIFQGYKCTACNFVAHKHCIMYSGGCMPVPLLVSQPVTPPLPLPCECTLSVEPWFVGEMGRATAASKLEHCEDGSYMLRMRPLGQPRLEHESCYALSIKADGVARHVKVFKRTVEGATLYYLSEARDFGSVVELVEYYMVHTLAENFEHLDARLLCPVR